MLFDTTDENLFKNSLLLSYHTGLPLLNSCLSRTPVSLVEKSFEIFNEQYDSLRTLANYDSQKKLLIYYQKNSLNSFCLIRFYLIQFHLIHFT